MAPRDNLVRTVDFRAVDTGSDDAGDGLTLEGYAAVWDTPTLIDSWEGTFNERIRRGAFRKSIRERTPRMQFDHGNHPLIGSIPIGTIETLREDDDGLWTSARLSDNWLIEPVRDAIRDRAIDGMSFRFSVIREEWTDVDGKRVKPDELDALLWSPGERGPLERTLVELRVHELGPVVWPAYEATTVGVRARDMAAQITGSGTLRRRVRESLAQSNATLAALDDAAFRREVATAVLLDVPARGDQLDPTPTPDDDAPPTTQHPSSPTHPDAPPAPGHPSTDSDAPPDQGHPPAMSASRLDPARIRRDAQMRAEYLSLIVKGSARYDERE
ncbi:HK97 family phage prohead protease [Actinomadura sp. NEAU-AAG7]|uniref:HK97 family phage prohead protease n=1 Tax=Actinomadura sp. NEAU-AAG7 TaxID=2839640 RepID=UPI001BE475A9|nr:HK97 family phage prohead protease [Actinomadura sp. NEAU-AAG7]MBT2213465.1 HK97 family phage prohead protease [Actinomadura sp. NEAU-AAG7]